MKKITLIILLLLLFGHCPAQNIFKFGWQKPFLGMKGKVKTSTEEAFELKWDNDTVAQESQGVVVYEFTEEGELKSKTTSYDDYKNTITYSQYENGRAMRFDQEISRPAYIDKDSSRIFVIDNKNERLVTWRSYNNDYACTDTTLIRYIGEIREITPLSNLRKLEITEIYDSRGNLIRETRSLRGKLGSWCVWDYDENDLLASESGTQPAGFGMMDDYNLFYDYKDFDKKGNWCLKTVNVKENQYDDDGDMITKRIIKREIKYY